MTLKSPKTPTGRKRKIAETSAKKEKEVEETENEVQERREREEMEKEMEKEIERETEKAKEVAKEAGKNTEKELQEEMKKEVVKEMEVELAREIEKEIEKDIRKEIEKVEGKEEKEIAEGEIVEEERVVIALEIDEIVDTPSTAQTTNEEEEDDYDHLDNAKHELEFEQIKSSLKYKYNIDKMLGSGSFGKVFMGTDIITNHPVALKFINKHFLTLSDRPDALEDELKVMLKLKHPHIVQLMDILNYWEGWMVVVMELCLGGTLIYDVVENTRKGLSERRSKKIFRQIAEAVNYLHSNNICHRDLNGANILMKNKGKDEIRIVDFGSARILKSKQEKLTTFSGAEVIRAPEITKKNKPYDPTKCDSWSMGCILYKMMTNSWPNPAVINKGITFPARISEDAKTLLSHLLDVNPKKRWTTEQMLACDWLKKDEDDVEGAKDKEKEKEQVKGNEKEKVKGRKSAKRAKTHREHEPPQTDKEEPAPSWCSIS